jgi:hypothetical protein
MMVSLILLCLSPHLEGFFEASLRLFGGQDAPALELGNAGFKV